MRFVAKLSVSFLSVFASKPVKSYLCLPQVDNTIVFVNIQAYRKTVA